MDIDDPILQAWRDATNCYLAGAGLPPLKEYRPPLEKICPSCGGKYVGSFCPMNACKEQS